MSDSHSIAPQVALKLIEQKVSHLVQNIEERGKLVLLASRRLNIRSEACPVQSCDAQKGTRLDRHLKRSHTELSDGAKTQLLDNLKRRLILGSLGALRASNPSVPMVSTLDLDEAADVLDYCLPQTSAADEGSTDIPSGEILCPPFPDHIPALNTLLEEYKELQEGPHPDAKLRHNVQNKLYRIRHFIGWMSKGQSGLAKLQFLDNQTRLKGWAGYLVDCGMVRTTSLHYLKNVRQFLVYVQETPPKTSRLGQKNVRMGIRYLKSVIKGWNRHVVQHQMSVKGRKDAVMHTVAELQQCRRLARLAIPKLLSKLEHQHSNSSLWKLQGYVAAYLASLYGYRLGVFLNMTDLEVSEAVHGDKDDYLLKMTHHKTNEAFGTAKMLLKKEEYGWLLKLIALKTKCASTKELSKFVFFNTTFGTNRNLTKHLQMVWSEMQLRGEVNFITLRTAVATFARDRHGEDSVQRKSMARLMCHDTATADRHYAMDLSVEQARNGRLLFEQAQETTNSRTLPQTQ
ncbi:Cytoplasmic tRNA 2-thiolation protein 1, partial [Dissostichus eleginoides]